MSSRYLPFLLILVLLLASACKSRRQPNRVADEKSQRFQSRQLSGTFSYGETLDFVNGDSVGWAAFIAETDSNEVLGYFFKAGEMQMLGTPHIRVEYFPQSFENAHSEAELFSWLKDMFLTPDRKGKLISETEKVPTSEGKNVHLLEIHTPHVEIGEGEDQVVRTPKFMVWAYLPAGAFWVGFSLTTATEADLTLMKPLMIDLIREFRLD